jgi:signal transduction histidine kinase
MDDPNLQDLQKQTFVLLLIVVAGLALTLLYILLVWLREALFYYDQYWWLPSALILLTCYLGYKLYRADKFRLGTHVFIGGLILAANSFIVWPTAPFTQPQVYVLVLIVALAGVLISPHAAAQAAGFAVVVTAASHALASYDSLSLGIFKPLIAPLLMTCAMAAISWMSFEHLITTVQWALFSQRRADERSHELFESQQELKKAYQMLETTNVRLQQAEAAATQANELKTRFITNLSHELRTPLSAIINFSYILSENYHGTVTKEQQDYLLRIHDSGELLLEIVNDLLDLAKIESGQMNLFVEPVDLITLGASVMNTITGLAAPKPIELRQEFPPELPPVKGDATRIRQVLLNLLGNAVKYTDEGSITLRLANGDQGFIQISVIDTGIGIQEKDFETIFEEFRQTEEAFALRKQGTGLGLPISKKFIELHEGKLWVESKVGQGSTFHFTLPIAVPTTANTSEPGEQVVDFIENKVRSL